MHTWNRGIVLPGLLITLVFGLVFVEPDRGTAILLAAVSGAMLLIAGVRWRYIVPPVLLGAFALTVSILRDPMRMKRIFSWWDLEQHKEGVGYQAYQSTIALGSGGWTGLGLGNGRQKLGFVPEDHTDFIFAIIGEELGLIATLFILLAFVVIVICGIYIALNSHDTFGFLLAAGLTSVSLPAHCRTRACRCRSSVMAVQICSPCSHVSEFYSVSRVTLTCAKRFPWPAWKPTRFQ
jgi:cell division protein FtsW